MMRILLKIIGILLFLIGLSLLLMPDRIVDWVLENSGTSWFYSTAIVGRIILGGILILAARQSKFPMVLKVLGYLSLVAAFVFLIIGHSGFADFISSLLPQFQHFAPLAGILSAAFGFFLIYAVSGRKRE